MIDVKQILLDEFAKKLVTLTVENVKLEDEIKALKELLIKSQNDVTYWRETYYDVRNLIMRGGEEEIY